MKVGGPRQPCLSGRTYSSSTVRGIRAHLPPPSTCFSEFVTFLERKRSQLDLPPLVVLKIALRGGGSSLKYPFCFIFFSCFSQDFMFWTLMLRGKCCTVLSSKIETWQADWLNQNSKKCELTKQLWMITRRYQSVSSFLGNASFDLPYLQARGCCLHLKL